MANDIPVNDIPFDRNTFNLIDYDVCKEVVHGLVHNAHHTLQSIEALTNNLWPLIHTDEARIAVNRDPRERWAHKAKKRDRHQGHMLADNPRHQNLDNNVAPAGNSMNLYNGQQTKNTWPGNSPCPSIWVALPQGICSKIRITHANDGHHLHV